MTRLAPSPTGSLHLGNLRTFLFTWLVARSRGWLLHLRMEDLDAGRVRDGAAAAIVDAMRWLGIDWDGAPLTQSSELEPYRAAMRALAAASLTYPCDLTRAEIRAALSAPHADGGECPFPPRLRPPRASWGFDDPARGHRFATPDGLVRFVDVIAGTQQSHPSTEIGDFIVWTRDGVPSYQLAVAVDDARQGVTDVIRGDDLLSSAGRQTLLHASLSSSTPRWWHLPLVLGSDGRRLAKRDGTHQIDALQRDGALPERILGLLGAWLGLMTHKEPISAQELLAEFVRLDASATSTATLSQTDEVPSAAVASVPPTPVTLLEEDLAWLRSPPITMTHASAPPD